MAEEIPDANSDAPPPKPEQNSTEDKVINGKVNHEHYQADPEAQEMVVESLRNQIQDLFSQVTQLNAKLVKSYDRVSDLEDDLHVASAQLRTSSVKVSQLELERTQHLAALNTGLLVEKHHVTTELNRLMEKATEEAAQRGQAESARVAIEKELDDLSANLFNQANTMVAEARYAQHLSDRKANDAEQALKGAEEAVSLMQQQVQALQEEKEIAERKATEMQSLVGKGKWVERRDSQGPTLPLRLFNSHVPYQEFILFVTHLRHLHTTSSNVPAMSTLLPLPFLTRLSTEDSEPTVRLDLAPSLNWLSRRSVLAAIHNGQLTIEPMSLATLLTEFSHLPNTGISGHSNNENIPCALCGMPIFPQAPSTNTSPSRPPSHPLRGMTQSYQGSGSWSANFFKKASSGVNTNIPNPSSILSRSPTHTAQTPSSSPIYPSQIYIFRISTVQASALPQLPLIKSTASSASGTSTPTSSYQPAPAISLSSGVSPNSNSTIYPICSTSWCLARLRATCSLWAFVRMSIVEKIWEEEIPIVSPPTVRSRVSSSATLVSDSTNPNSGSGTTEKPPLPPRKRGLWGLASAVGEKAASWGGKSTVASEKEKEDGKALPPPPAPPTQEPAAPPIPSAPAAVPPPLPKRSEGRARTPNNQPSPSPEPAPVENSIKPTTSDQPPREIPPTGPLEDKTAPPAPPSEPVVKKDELPVTATPETPIPPASAPAPAAVAVAAPSSPQTPTRARSPMSSPTPPPAIPPRAAKRLSASLARPGTPSSIPLPDSRPGTPPVPFPGATPNPPSRTASPALGGGSPSTPPPIPRRAAARAPRKPDSRPGSPAIISSSTTTVIPGSPLKSGDVQAQAQSAAPVQLGSVKEAVEGKEEAKKTSTPVTQPKVLEVPKAPVQIARSESNVSASETEVFVDAEDGLQGEKEKEGERKSKEEQAAAHADKGSKETKEPPKDNDSVNRETKQETKDTSEEKTRDQQGAISLNDGDLPPSLSAGAPPPVPPRSRPVKNEVAKPEADKEEDEDKDTDSAAENESDAHNYVGDATWEERTWKELTRLREEMFWARIGAIRS